MLNEKEFRQLKKDVKIALCEVKEAYNKVVKEKNYSFAYDVYEKKYKTYISLHEKLMKEYDLRIGG